MIFSRYNSELPSLHPGPGPGPVTSFRSSQARKLQAPITEPVGDVTAGRRPRDTRFRVCVKWWGGGPVEV